MNKKIKDIKRVGFRFLCLILVVISIFLIPTRSQIINDNMSRIYGYFVGEKSKFNGLIEIWNIDSFESGSLSKEAILNFAASEFQKKYRGCYVLVRNISEQECLNMLLQGQKPDLFSCSYGVSGKIADYLQGFEIQDFGLNENFLQAGKVNDSLFGVAWCCGLYFLMTTKKSLSNAMVEYNQDFSLSKNAFLLGYQTGNKKKKNIYSVVFSNKGYLMPKASLLAYNKIEENKISELSFNKTKSYSQYDAYIDFLIGNSVLLLGTQRDVVRLNNRIKNGKIQDVIYEPILSSSDLVQFMFLAKSDDENKRNYIEKFVLMLFDKNIQKKISEANLFSTLKDAEFQYEIEVMNRISNEHISNLKINNAFLSKSEINKFQSY